MTRFFLVASAAATAIASAATAQEAGGVNASSGCQTGLIISGLWGNLDGDYISQGAYMDDSYQRDLKGGVSLGLAFSCKVDQGGDGCFSGAVECDTKYLPVVTGKWAIFSFNGYNLPTYTPVAVCEEGCPDIPVTSDGHCVQHSGDYLFPAGAAVEQMTWRSVGGSTNVAASAVSATCCKQKVTSCDACGGTMCSDLIHVFGLFNHCPPHGGSSLTPVQQACCIESGPDSPIPSPPHCSCLPNWAPPTMICEHDDDTELVV